MQAGTVYRNICGSYELKVLKRPWETLTEVVEKNRVKILLNQPDIGPEAYTCDRSLQTKSPKS